MTTNADLIAEARQAHASHDGKCLRPSDCPYALFPQLADALKRIQISYAACAHALRDMGEERKVVEARLAKVRELAIRHDVSVGRCGRGEPQAGCRRCRLCLGTWTHDGPEIHDADVDCPARPMEPGTS